MNCVGLKKSAICKRAYSKEDLCLTSVVQQVNLETNDRFTRNFAWKLNYIRKYLIILRPNS